MSRGLATALASALAAASIAAGTPAAAQDGGEPAEPAWAERVDCDENVRDDARFGGETYCIRTENAGSSAIFLRETGAMADIPFVAEFGGMANAPPVRVQFGSTDPLLRHRAVDMTCNARGLFGIGNCHYSFGGGGFVALNFLGATASTIEAVPVATPGLDTARGAQMRFGEGEWTALQPIGADRFHAFRAPGSLVKKGLESDPPFVEIRYHLAGAEEMVTRRYATRFVEVARMFSATYTSLPITVEETMETVGFEGLDVRPSKQKE